MIPICRHTTTRAVDSFDFSTTKLQLVREKAGARVWRVLGRVWKKGIYISDDKYTLNDTLEDRPISDFAMYTLSQEDHTLDRIVLISTWISESRNETWVYNSTGGQHK